MVGRAPSWRCATSGIGSAHSSSRSLSLAALVRLPAPLLVRAASQHRPHNTLAPFALGICSWGVRCCAHTSWICAVVAVVAHACVPPSLGRARSRSVCHRCAHNLASWAHVNVASFSFSDPWDDDEHYSSTAGTSRSSSKNSLRHQRPAHCHTLPSSSSSRAASAEARSAQHRTSGLSSSRQHHGATHSRSRASGAPTTSTDVARRMIMHVLGSQVRRDRKQQQGVTATNAHRRNGSSITGR